MKSPKALTSAIVAAALAGGIGLAYAQTADQGAGNGAPGANAAFNSAPAANNSADTMAAPAPSTDTSVQVERPAQADRN
ncbi:MAG: hypothetical protein V4451_21915 [Pseudomonadota bacterium]